MDNHFGKERAEAYDEPEQKPERQENLRQMIAALRKLAEDGPVLEFAIGTGRVALALAETGLTVSGIELSRDMLDVMARKPGAEAIQATQGDMATTRIPGAYSLVVLVYNTIGNLLEQDAQVACFENAARHLRPGGRFVIENLVPPLRLYPPGAAGVPFTVGADHTGIDMLDPAAQSMVTHHYERRADGTMQYHATPQRYTWPSELDLMARIAGLRLEHRWGGWDRSAFAGDSAAHVSVWRKPE